jgi:hypothetical protein
MNFYAADRSELFASGRLRSLWDMLTLDARRFANLIFALTYLQMDLRKQKSSDALMPETKAFLKKSAEEMAVDFESLELTTSAEMIRHAFDKCEDCDALFKALDMVRNTFFIELNRRKFYAPGRDFMKYYEQSSLFGNEVFSNFASANEDIQEAGTCLALERATACVMHLNRALEVSLRALANALSVGPQSNWGAYLSKIDKELETRVRTSGARSSEEQFYAEAAANFDRLRRAYRNPTMHPERTYSIERAEEILLGTKAFMAHLATKISE